MHFNRLFCSTLSAEGGSNAAGSSENTEIGATVIVKELVITEEASTAS